MTSGRRQYARCPRGFLLPTGIRSQRVKVALPASSLFLQVSDTGPTHESPFRFCPHSESSYCCFPAPACHLIRKFLLDTGSWEDFSDISGQMLTESSAHPMLSDHTVAPPPSLFWASSVEIKKQQQQRNHSVMHRNTGQIYKHLLSLIFPQFPCVVISWLFWK